MNAETNLQNLQVWTPGVWAIVEVAGTYQGDWFRVKSLWCSEEGARANFDPSMDRYIAPVKGMVGCQIAVDLDGFQQIAGYCAPIGGDWCNQND